MKVVHSVCALKEFIYKVTHRSSVGCILKDRCVVVSVSDVDVHHGGVGAAAGVSGGDGEDVAPLLLEVERLRHRDQTTTVLRRDGETTAGVPTRDLVMQPIKKTF